MKKIITVFVVVVATALAGCGGGSSASTEVTSTFKQYLTALANGQGAHACNQLSGSEAQALIQAAASSGVTTCEQAITYVSGNLGGDNKQTLQNAKVTNVHVNGNTATADLQGGATTADFTKVGGHWFISGGLNPGGGSAGSSVQSGASTATTTSPATSTTSTSAGTGTSPGAPSTPLAGSVKALHDLLKLAGYAVTAVQATGTSGVPGVPGSATAPGQGFQATKNGTPVEVISFASMQAADRTAAGLEKGAAAGRGAVKQVGTDLFFAVGSGSGPQTAVDAIAALVQGKGG